ncbi:hypothetical protein JW868_00565 [Candidatus Woesearchaeota archaeon]|nr:hypothetical protein [Candidatus Woesearchaeota archaeon]
MKWDHQYNFFATIIGIIAIVGIVTVVIATNPNRSYTSTANKVGQVVYPSMWSPDKLNQLDRFPEIHSLEANIVGCHGGGSGGGGGKGTRDSWFECQVAYSGHATDDIGFQSVGWEFHTPSMGHGYGHPWSGTEYHKEGNWTVNETGNYSIRLSVTDIEDQTVSRTINFWVEP